jgi:hypothetical protein
MFSQQPVGDIRLKASMMLALCLRHIAYKKVSLPVPGQVVFG